MKKTKKVDMAADVKAGIAGAKTFVVYGAINVRTTRAIVRAEKEFFDRVWYFHSLPKNTDYGSNVTAVTATGTSVAAIRQRQRKLEKKYGKTLIHANSEANSVSIGIMLGTLSTLRWVLGDVWGNFDSQG